MSDFLVIAFLFYYGSILGWCIEVLFRKFFSKANPERVWINPGFCVGPYLPLYGVGLIILYHITLIEELKLFSSPVINTIFIFVLISVTMTLIELIAGLLAIKLANVRLWDYRNQWGNYKGIICPKFSLIWALLGAAYYFFLHKTIIDWIEWLSLNLAFSFFIGLFFGIFIIDACMSLNVMNSLRKFAKDNNIVINFKRLQKTDHEKSIQEQPDKKDKFFKKIDVSEPLNKKYEDIKSFTEEKVSKIKSKKKKKNNKK